MLGPFLHHLRWCSCSVCSASTWRCGVGPVSIFTDGGVTSPASTADLLFLSLLTSSRRSATPRLIPRWSNLGESEPSKRRESFVPTGILVQPDGTAILLTMAVLFIADADGQDRVGR